MIGTSYADASATIRLASVIPPHHWAETWNKIRFIHECRKSSESVTHGYIWLKDVCALSFKEFTEAIACVLVLSCRDKRRLDSLLQLGVAVVVIGRETFFYPFYIVGLQ